MGVATSIQKIGLESFDIAFYLLRRFFDEEGFSTPTQEIQSSLHAVLISPSNAVFLARYGGEIAGVATVSTTVGIEYGRSAELEDLYVLPLARGHGVASRLIEAVCTWCHEQGCTTVLVTVTPEGQARHDLLRFYKGYGFANTERAVLTRSLRPDV